METFNQFCVGEFESIAMQVVYSATDVDVQIIISGEVDNPIRKVKIFGPNHRLFAYAMFNDKRRIGQADFQFDTPEPSLEGLIKAYPEGTYKFIAQ